MKMNWLHSQRPRTVPVLLGALLLQLIPLSLSAAVDVSAAVEKQEVYLGESFLFQIQVAGSDQPEEPDLSAITDFTVTAAGQRANNSTSVSIVNGRVNKQVTHGYIFTYRLSAKRLGDLQIPPVSVKVDGTVYETRAIPIRAKKPEETDDFKLRQSLARTRCYVGEAVSLKVEWFIGAKIRGVDFSLPLLDHPAFDVIIPEPDVIRANQDQYYRIPIGTREVIMEKKRGKLDGHPFTTLTFEVILFPKRAGTFQLPQGTVACEALAGYSKSRSPFGSSDFFNGFFGGRKEEYRAVVIPSNRPTLEVRTLPQAGRPDGFSGHVGRFEIHTSASPLEVKVGDPITLTITLSGPDYLENVELPPLSEQADLARNFKIPNEMAPGTIEGETKVFRQTIRALHAEVEEIPSVKLPYFDTAEGDYSVAQSDPIPLTVAATKVVTVRDAQGSEPVGPTGKRLTAWQRGIRHNYTDLSVLTDQRWGLGAWPRSPLFLACLAAPPFLYALLFGTVTFNRRRRADPTGKEAKRAASRLTRDLARISKEAEEASGGSGAAYAEMLDALRTFFGRKLRTPHGALTFADLKPRLEEYRVEPDDIAFLAVLFELGEAGRYGYGAADGRNIAADCETLKAVVKRLDRTLSGCRKTGNV